MFINDMVKLFILYKESLSENPLIGETQNETTTGNIRNILKAR